MQRDAAAGLAQPSVSTVPVLPPASAIFPPPQPEPLPETVRRFLRPLLGVDPAVVHIRRDESAQEAVSQLGADAVAVGDTVLLHPERSMDSPATLGVLAHELTHIARKRDPTFVPPILREDGAPGLVQPSAGRTIVGPSSEEEMARAAETAVRDAARAELRDPGTLPALERAGSPPAIGEAGPPVAGGALPALRASSDWGGLPAPWEPLPATIFAPTEAPAVSSSPGTVHPAATSPPHVESSRIPPHLTSFDAEPLVVQRAETERALPSIDSVSSFEHNLAGGVVAEEHDLDALARDVYTILKRRLQAELRRHGKSR